MKKEPITYKSSLARNNKQVEFKKGIYDLTENTGR